VSFIVVVINDADNSDCISNSVLRNCIGVGTMSSASPVSSVDHNFPDENVSADTSVSKYRVVTPQRSILKDSNACNIVHSAPQSLDTVKVLTVSLCFICYQFCLLHVQCKGSLNVFMVYLTANNSTCKELSGSLNCQTVKLSVKQM